MRLAVAALEVGDDALEGGVEGAAAILALVFEVYLLAVGAVEQLIDDIVGKLAHGRIQRKAVLVGQPLQIHLRHGIRLGAVPAGDLNGSLRQRLAAVGDDHVGVHLQKHAEAGTGGTGAVGVVEGEHARRQFLDGDVAVRAGVVLGKEHVLPADNVDDHQPARQLHRRFQRIREALLYVRSHSEAIDHHFQRVFFRLGEFGRVGYLIDFPVHAHAHEALLAHVLEEFCVFTLAGAHHRGHHLYARALGQRQHLIDDLIDGLLANLLAAHGAVRHAGARVEQAQVVVDLRDRAHGRARVFRGGLLVDGDGGRKAVDGIHVRLLHLPQKLAGVGGERFHIAALPLGVDGIEGQRAFAGAGKAGHDDEAVARQF